MHTKHTMTRSTERGPSDSFERERRAFHALLESLQTVTDLSEVEQRAVAFVGEDMKRDVPETWERSVAALADALQSANAQEGVPGVTWQLAQAIHDRYDAFLTRRLQAEQDPTRRENLEILQQGIQRDFPTRREAYEAKRRVPMGSVILEHVPTWFPQV